MVRSGRSFHAVKIPEDRVVDWLFDQLISGGYCQIQHLKDGSMSWCDVWRACDMLDLRGWVDWEQHIIAEAGRGGS